MTTPRSSRVALPAFAPWFAALIDLPMRPLRVTLHLQPGASLAGNDALQLDNLLARRVLDVAIPDRGPLDDTPLGYEFPIPLRVVWRADDGLPLYAATPFVPVGTTATDIAYLHKRQQTGAWTRGGRAGFAPRPASGRWAERRQGIRSVLAEAWTADCIGHQDTIAELLRAVVHVGKKRGHGFGAVARWEIAPIPAWHLVRAGRLTRPVPALAATRWSLCVEGEPALVGWTPPQWKPSLFRPGWWAGARVHDVEALAC